MKLKEKIIAVLAAIIIALGGGYTATNLGSVQDGHAYNSTTTPTISGALLMVKEGQGTLGSVVIGVTSATTFELRDATSTTDVASTTLLQVAASPAIGSTMTLDTAFTRGLSIVFPASFTGRYTITYR